MMKEQNEKEKEKYSVMDVTRDEKGIIHVRPIPSLTNIPFEDACEAKEKLISEAVQQAATDAAKLGLNPQQTLVRTKRAEHEANQRYRVLR